MAKKKQGLAAVEEMMSGEQPQVEETQEPQAEETKTQTQPEESNEAKEELVQAETNDNSSNDVPTETPQEVSTPSFFEEVGRTREEVEESLARAERFKNVDTDWLEKNRSVIEMMQSGVDFKMINQLQSAGEDMNVIDALVLKKRLEGDDTPEDELRFLLEDEYYWDENLSGTEKRRQEIKINQAKREALKTINAKKEELKNTSVGTTKSFQESEMQRIDNWKNFAPTIVNSVGDLKVNDSFTYKVDDDGKKFMTDVANKLIAGDPNLKADDKNVAFVTEMAKAIYTYNNLQKIYSAIRNHGKSEVIDNNHKQLHNPSTNTTAPRGTDKVNDPWSGIMNVENA